MGRTRDDFAYIAEVPITDERGISTGRAQRVECSVPGCGACYDMTVNRHRRPPDQVYKAAGRAGWKTDAKKGQHLCPDHANPPKEATVPSQTTAKPSPSETPPRELTRDAKRSIFRAIDDAYDTANNCYALDVTDDSIAAELKVPVGWVREVREDNFGPAGPDPALVELRAELDMLKEDAKEAAAKAKLALSEVQRLEADIKHVSERLKRRGV
jgi:hypothetical protein